ncbi:MAG: 4-hydroxythreonine-4-phosphate dehydrogenase PdxA [Chloroflexi bacterium]|nr:4-hydroxythreonine-4-phosphate dehydrogenase PdxA [Chloroflexota bacterium]
MEDRPVILVTLGDPCGIGPEVVSKALADPETYRHCRPVVVGSSPVLQEALRLVRSPLRVQPLEALGRAKGQVGTAEVLDPSNLDPQAVIVGRASAAAGKAAMEWVMEAGRRCLVGEAAGMATAPINKEACRMAGFEEIGHMEVLQRLSHASNVATMLVAGSLRVVHLTTHRSLRRACDAVTRDNLLAKLELTHECFQRWGFPHPRIGVAALNPHASDGGLLGTEEAEHIAPAVEEATRRGIAATGPVPADIVFHQAIRGRFDVVLALYHDQGHIPVKVHGFEQSISVNLGLPFVRTSVDHGTAFDIAGQGVASPVSMIEAIRVAALLASEHRLPQG